MKIKENNQVSKHYKNLMKIQTKNNKIKLIRNLNNNKIKNINSHHKKPNQKNEDVVRKFKILLNNKKKYQNKSNLPAIL